AGPLGPVIAGLLVREPQGRLSAPEAERMLRACAAETETETESVPRDGLVSPAGPARAGRSGAGGSVTAPVPSPVSASVPGPRARGRRAPLWAAAFLVPALAGGGAYAVPLLRDVDRTGAGPSRSASAASTPDVSPAASATARPSVRPTPAHTPPPVPEGYHLAEERERGFSVPVPDGWKRQVSDDGRQFVYVDPTGLVGLRVAALDFAGPSPLRHFEDVEAQMVPDLRGYERLRMQSTRWRGKPAAIWEFTFQGSARGFRAIDLGFGEPGGQEFTVYLSAPSDRWASYRAVFDNAVDGFRQDTP
ncbi:serine/threonine protein kinase, partial [Streptomyces sp. NPDC005722]